MGHTLSEIQRNVADIANRAEYTPDIIYELLAAYGRSRAAITQLRTGHLNKAETGDAVLQKDVVYFCVYPKGTQLEFQVQDLFKDPLTERYNPRYLIATDLVELAAKDTVKGTTLSIKLADIDNELDFFYAWTGDEVVDTKTEAVADRRAADKMNELYIEIEKENRDKFVNNPNFRHELNVFFTRLLFCYFAEDTEIYKDNQFTGAIKTFTQPDGSDLSWFFGELFNVLDTKDENKSAVKSPFKEFPYVNGSIFNTSKHSIAIPKFSAQARHLILECGRQNWGEINPDIFGTMFQGIVDPTSRDESGMDYTSVPNIMKVIQPLFLDDLHEQFDKHYDNEKKLWSLLNRISVIKIFDPACGSGNFLIISYKNLRQLQHKIIARIGELKPGGLSGRLPSTNLLDVDHLYGIELDDFARELAILSIFLAKHQMNMEFNKQFGTSLTIIPLIELNTIVHGNAARLDWQIVCPNTGHIVTQTEQGTLFDIEGDQVELPLGSMVYDEIYLIGNPPYKGAAKQTLEQKADIKAYFDHEEYSGSLDYIALWFIKGARYISGTKSQLAFVSTNSVAQGEQVGIMFPKIIEEEIEIGFAYTSFKWQNSARDQAGVIVVIICLRNVSKKSKIIFTNGIAQQVENINAYLTNSEQDYILPISKSISGFPDVKRANALTDDNNFNLTDDEAKTLRALSPSLVKNYFGAEEFINGKYRPILWLNAADYETYKQNEIIKSKVEAVRKFRLGLKSADGIKAAATPWAIKGARQIENNAIILPRVSSERRIYIPIGYLEIDDVIGDSAIGAYDADPWLFALLESKMHMVWIKSICGYLGTSIRYSSTLGYNTFPVSPLSEKEKGVLNISTRRILLTRAAHPEKTLADMYDPDKMPADLREAHNKNDRLVDSLYKQRGFKNDNERLAALFDLYEIMKAKEKSS